MSQTIRNALGRLVSTAVLAAAALSLAACTSHAPVVTHSIPFDYRDRHPIRITEGEHAVELLVGSARGDLTAEQRAQVTWLAGEWRRDSTGRLLIEVPKGTKNARAAAYAGREAQSVLRAAGVPARAITVKGYETSDQQLGTVRLSYARIEAVAGPCGSWPEDLGSVPFPSLQRMPANFDNRPYWNSGCATQQNFAAAVANPEDLIQPRASEPSYAARRQKVMEKYRAGENPSGRYETEEVSASDIAQ
jgi:pilus assembly protein CpaD